MCRPGVVPIEVSAGPQRVRNEGVSISEVAWRTVTRRGEHDPCERYDRDVGAGVAAKARSRSVATEREPPWVSANAGTLTCRPVRSEARRRSVAGLAACPSGRAVGRALQSARALSSGVLLSPHAPPRRVTQRLPISRDSPDSKTPSIAWFAGRASQRAEICPATVRSSGSASIFRTSRLCLPRIRQSGSLSAANRPMSR